MLVYACRGYIYSWTHGGLGLERYLNHLRLKLVGWIENYEGVIIGKWKLSNKVNLDVKL